MRRAFLWIVDHSALAATLVALLTLALAAQLPKLEIDASAEGLMVANDPAREYYEDAKRKFGSDTVTIVLVKAEDVFTSAVLGAVRRLSDAFERIEGVRRVDSLTTVRNLSGRGDFLDTDLLVAPEIPTAPADLGRIRDDALRHRVIAGNLVAATGRATAIYVFTDLGLLDREFNKRLTDRVEALIRQEAAPGLTIHQIGGPITQVTLGEFMHRDLVRLITTDLSLLIQFGSAAAMALTANFVVPMGLAPALLAVWPVSGRSGVVTPQDERSVGGLPEFMARLGESLIRHRGAIVLIFLAISLASLVGWANLRVNTDFLSYFPEDAFIRKRVADFQQSLGGGDSFYPDGDTRRAGGAKEPAVLRTVAQLQDFLTATAKIDKTVSLADFLKTMHREMNGGDPGFEVIPPTRDLVAQYLLILEGNDLSRYLDFDAAAANIVVNHHIRSSWEFATLLAQLDAYRATLDPALAIRVTGESVLIHNAADVMAINEVTSFIFTFIVIGLIHAWLFRSVIAAVLTLIPNLIPILVGFVMLVAMVAELALTAILLYSIPRARSRASV